MRLVYELFVAAYADSMGDHDATTDEQLDEAASDTIPGFLAAVPADTAAGMIPSLRPGESCIANTDETGLPGVHWCAFAADESGVYGYDSFGRDISTLSPYFYEIRGSYAQSHPGREQSWTSELCGQRSLAWLRCCRLFGARLVASVI